MLTLITTLCCDDDDDDHDDHNNDRGFPFSWCRNDLVTKKGRDGLSEDEAFYIIIELKKEIRN